MRPFVRSIASIVMSLSFVGCGDFLGIGDDVDVEVIAEVRQTDNVIAFTVENRGSDTIYFHSARLERRDDGEWHSTLPPGFAVIDILLVHPIGPGENHMAERPIVVDPTAPFPRPIPLTLSSGTYRYKLSMSEDSNANRSLPEDARTSNTVRID